MASGLSLNIDTTKSEFQNPMVELRQGDGNYQSLRVTVTSNGEPLMLDGWIISFMGTTAGGHKIVDSDTHVINASNGVFDYTPTKAWGQDIGEFDKAYFKFTNGNESASGANFRVKVFEAVDLTDEEAGNYISVVDVMIDKIKTDMDNKLYDTQKTLSDTKSQATTVQGNVNDLNTNVNELKAQNNNIRTANNVWSGTNKFNSGATFSPGIEITADLPFIDFHYGNDTSDYTSRIIEDKNGTLSFYSNDGVKMFLNANANDPQAVHNTGDETINGNKTFTSPINGKTIKIELPNGTDLNNVTAYGSYSGYGNGFLNLPTSSELQFDMVVMQQGVFSSQIIISYTGDTSLLHYRSLVNGVWQPWKKMAIDTTVVHNTGNETISGDKTFRSGNYGLRVTSSGVQKTSDNGVTWTNI